MWSCCVRPGFVGCVFVVSDCVVSGCVWSLAELGLTV